MKSLSRTITRSYARDVSSILWLIAGKDKEFYYGLTKLSSTTGSVVLAERLATDIFTKLKL